MSVKIFKPYDRIELPPKHPNDSAYLKTVSLISPNGLNDATVTDTGFLQSRTITSVSNTLEAGLTLASETNTTTTVTFGLTGGTAGTSYELDCQVTLSTSEVKNLTIIIPVLNPGDN